MLNQSPSLHHTHLPRAVFLPKSVSSQCRRMVATAPDIGNNSQKESVVWSQDSELSIPCSYLHFSTLLYFPGFIISHLVFWKEANYYRKEMVCLRVKTLVLSLG